MSVRIVWADDDCDRTLASFGRLLRRRKIGVLPAKSYRGALNALEQAKTAGEGITVLLADVILPHEDHGGALDPQLGLRLAKRGISFGLKRIGFLTVVPQTDVQVDFDDLRTEGVELRYFDKASLLEPDELDRIVEFLKGNAQ